MRGWAEGLVKLLDTLRRQKVPQTASKIQFNPGWEIYRRRGAISINNEPERLTSNWIRVVEVPDVIRYFEPTGAVERYAIKDACRAALFPAEPHRQGFFSFATVPEINDAFAYIGRFEAKHEVNTLTFVQSGSEECGSNCKSRRLAWPNPVLL